MNAAEKKVEPDIEHLVLQTRAAHVYLDAIGNLSNPERKRQNQSQAESVLSELDRFLSEASPDAATRARIEELRGALKAQLERTVL